MLTNITHLSLTKNNNIAPNTTSTSKGSMMRKTQNCMYKILATQKDAITRIKGVIMPEAINNLENKIGGIFTILKSTHFDKGQRCNYIACIIPEAKYQLVIGNNAWVYAAPGNPGAYMVASLGAGLSSAQCKQLVPNHKEEQVNYTKYLRAQEAGKELILYGMGNDALASLKKQYISFGDATVHLMIKNLCKKSAIKVTTSQKYDYKNKGYCKAWDPIMSIMAYFTGPDKFQISLNKCGVSMSIEEKTMVVGT
jgi:hypothetical protein